MHAESQSLRWSHMPPGLFTGTSGLVLPYKNMSFYPDEFSGKSRLEVYGLLNNSIEINSTFYKIPKKSTVARWNDSVPSGFRFTFKLARTLTHTKGLPFPVEDLDSFMDGLAAIDQVKSGCILVQFPASFKMLHWKLFTTLIYDLYTRNENQKWHISVEFRDISWYRDETYLFLKELGISIVMHDKAGGASSSFDDTIAEHVYVRFHGPEGDYKGTYEDTFLHEYATYVKEWLSLGRNVFIYFNNTMGNALLNMKTLLKETMQP